jgi:hypothetical protein
MDTCEPTECIAGWHVSKPNLNLEEIINEEAGINSAYINSSGLFNETNYDNKGKKGQEYYGISGNNAFAVDYGERGMLTGHGRCSTQEGYGIWTDYNSVPNNPKDVTLINNLMDETGQSGALYCYCQLDSYKPINGNKVDIIDAPWVFGHADSSADNCASRCADNCAFNLRENYPSRLVFRKSVFYAIPNITNTNLMAICAANTINIDWDPDNGGEHIKNMCTYDDAITLPTPDPVKPGYTFTGWKLLENTTTE